LAAQFGIETELWIGRALARRGRRRQAARLFVDAARRGRRPALLGQAAVALAGPAARRALDRSRALLEEQRTTDETRRLVAELEGRARVDDPRLAPFVGAVAAAEQP
jgi:hypothetical protein